MAAYARSQNRMPALFASLLLHAGVIAAGLIVWPWARHIVPVEVTPVTLLTSADLARLTAAQQSDTAQTAQVEEPAEVPDTQPVAPTPAPVVTPPPAPAPQPKAMPAPSPSPKVADKTPVPKPPIPKEPPTKAKGVNLDALAASLAANTAATGASKTRAERGPARPELDLSNRPSDGLARAATNTSLGQIQAKLIRLWNPNCGIEGASGVIVPVRMSLNQDGSLAKKPELVTGTVETITDPVMKAAAIRAISAVSRGSPYDGLPREDYAYWKTVILNFDAKKACRGL
jgi:outer membrane biosynthesis protein TonB